MTGTRRSLAARLLGLLLPLSLTACETARGLTSPAEPPAGPRLATVPAKGTASTLDFATWNIEWFGDRSNGPGNETLQLENVRDVILGSDLDVWAFQEVVDSAHWNRLESQLTGYTGFVANEAHVTDGPAYYSGFSNTEQKVGILYKSSVATLLGAKIILTGNDYDFGGRPPLEVKLRVSLNGVTEDVVVIVMHMKCCTDETSYQRRLNASNALKSYLDTTYPTQKVWVIGDWNDDVDASISTGKASPYKNFVDDLADYRFPTKALSDAGISSTVSYSDMIDHHLFTNEGEATYVAGSAEVYRVDQYIASYSTTTSDHFPVLSRYTFGSGGGGGNAAPAASFTYSCSGLTCSFTDTSTDSDGTVASWSWSFGDGATSSAQHPSRTYAAGGSYTVQLTVTDNGGATGSRSQTVTVTAPSSGISLSVAGRKSKGYAYADLSWSGAAGTSVDVYRNGAKITTTPNDGAHTDSLGKVAGTFKYRVCEAGTTTCSNEASVTF